MKIYVGSSLQSPELAALARVTAGDDVWHAGNGAPTDASRRAFLDAEVVLGPFPEDLLNAASRLRWVQLTSVGIDFYRHIDWLKLRDQVVCTNVRGIFAEPMAQSVLAGILALNRGLDQVVRLQATRDWQKDYLHPRLYTLRGAHVLLLGAGSVMTRLRELLAHFGCTFTIYGRTSGDIHTPAELDDALPKADIVCAALPDTPGTRGLLDAARIARFKPGALFLNVGRGTLLDEAALVAALRAGRLRGALLDVTATEPPAPEDPLWRCPRLILTQHTAAASDREHLDTVSFFGVNLARYRAGQPLLNVIDWEKGY
ncbi:MAG: D-2-hydroxyacid dehydrogenase [Verrucomicrobia bacterium]|nr:D-2-hydroxyacid dehydrogenase [Verrucomicrobiota bacterium]